MLRRLARGGHDLEAGMGQQRHRGAPDTTRCAGHQNRPVLGRRAVLDETAERQEGGATGQADDGGGAAGQGVGQRHHPVGRDPRVGGEAAVTVHAEVVALHQHALSRREVGARALLDAAGSSTPGTSGKTRATRFPGRVTMASLKLMADHSTRMSTSPAGRSVSASSTTAGRMTAPALESR